MFNKKKNKIKALEKRIKELESNVVKTGKSKVTKVGK